MTRRPYVLAESLWPAVGERPFDVVLLPWGATEAHNYHLPYGTDVIETESVAIESARLAWARGARTVVLPTIPFGVQTGQRDIALCINMNPSTQAAVLRDVVTTVATTGARWFVILNGHGGNDFRQMIRELQPSISMQLVAVNWWQVADAASHFAEPGDHGGELETSVMMHLVPDLVAPLGDAGDGRERRPSVAGLRERWAWTPRPWTQVSADTGIGDPRAATAEKGMTYVAAVTTKIAGLITDLAATDPTTLYRI